MSDRIRAIRIIIYEGPREWVENTIERSIQGTKIIDPHHATTKKISGFTISQFPEIIKQHEENDESTF